MERNQRLDALLHTKVVDEKQRLVGSQLESELSSSAQCDERDYVKPIQLPNLINETQEVDD